MNDPLNPPAIIAPAVMLSAKTQELWLIATKKIKTASEAFVTAYKATLIDLIPNWEATWRKDPTFNARLVEIEQIMRSQCLRAGMPAATFNKYVSSARRAVLLKVPFRLAAIATVAVAKAIANLPPEAQQAFAQRKRAEQALNVLVRSPADVTEALLKRIPLPEDATVIPLPTDKDEPQEYFKLLLEKLVVSYQH